MDSFGKIILGGAAVFVAASLFFSDKGQAQGSGAKLPPPAPPQTRYTIKSGVSMFSPSDSFSAGDIVTVVLHDSQSNRDTPMVLMVIGNMGDPTGNKGLDCAYDPSLIGKVLPAGTPSPVALDGLLPGTHFAVFPRDVLAVLPKGADVKIPTLFSHVMTDTDIALTPVGFASLAGYGDSTMKADAIVNAFVADNPGLKVVTASDPASIGGVHPEIFPVFGKAPGSDIDTVQAWLAVQPWSVGMTVHTKVDMGGAPAGLPGVPGGLPFPAIPLTGAMAGENNLPHGVVPFGGRGFGQGKGAIALPRGGVG